MRTDMAATIPRGAARYPPTVRELYRDRWLVVIDKPSGVPSQAGQDGQPGLYEQLAEREGYVGLHHRLDRPASGLMLFTLDRGANKGVAELFAQGRIRRRYVVWVLGSMSGSGQWEAPVDGRSARSEWSAEHSGRISRLRVSLVTGRTHQIRRHAAGAGHPVLGDRRHGGAAGTLWPRLALHARDLDLVHPITGEELHLHAQPPEDLRGLP